MSWEISVSNIEEAKGFSAFMGESDGSLLNLWVSRYENPVAAAPFGGDKR